VTLNALADCSLSLNIEHNQITTKRQSELCLSSPTSGKTLSLTTCSSSVSSNLDNVRVQELEPRSELRVELTEASLRAVVASTSAAESDGGGSVAAGVCYFKLISGTAELFGTELAQVRGSAFRCVAAR
jgi:hypothetical protein